jgi:hypothetical protein
LLEPIHMVEIACPSDASTKINAILSGRLGPQDEFMGRPTWRQAARRTRAQGGEGMLHGAATGVSGT